MKWVPDTPGDLKVKGELSPHSGSVSLKQLNPIHKKGPYSFFKKEVFEALIYCIYSDFGKQLQI